VVIIFWNAERFLAEAIDSVLGQTFEDFELLLVDDGSRDGSRRIARGYARRAPRRVRVLEHEGRANRGMSAARNLGVRHARGRYVAFLDADDVWRPEKLAEQVPLLDSMPEAAMLYGRTLIWHGWTGKPEDQNRDFSYELGVPPDTLVDPPALVHVMLDNSFQTPTTCNALVRRSVIEDVGGFQEDFRGMFEDQAFFTKVCLAHRVYVSSACWALYRQHPDSCCAIAERTGRAHGARLPFLRWMESYLRARGVSQESDPDGVWKALHRELRAYPQSA
jgi:glycosyltransferase involved in cell wall biosynthesis